MILIENTQQDITLDIDQLERDAQKILDSLNYSDYDLGILLTTNDDIHTYNKQYRSQDKPTDILSFAYHDTLKAGQRIVPQSDDDKNLGDIIIAPQYVQDDLPRWQQSFEQRMRVLLVHGICHLLGYDHIQDEDYEVMHKAEQSLLEQLDE
jgi:probable rRNA maturation factor